MNKFLLLLLLLAGASPAFAQMDPCSEPYMPCPQNLYNPVGPARQGEEASRHWRERQQQERDEDAGSGQQTQEEDQNPYAVPPPPRSNVRHVPPGTPYYGN
ncbi:MAG: hypothetical protein HY053_07315 [Proteobacteria bacterium]|nr:hypothetical protein [Pseudomonadota bacterium]